jgi:hypothetical protein
VRVNIEASTLLKRKLREISYAPPETCVVFELSINVL